VSIASAFSLIFGLLWGFVQFRNDISIEPYSSLNPKLPFETRFAVTNQGPFTIYSLYYSCTVGYVHTSKGYLTANRRHTKWIIAVPEEKTELIPKAAKWSVHCDATNIFKNQQDIDQADLQIEVWYRPSFWPFHIIRGEAFIMKRDSSGNAQWIYLGQAMSPKEFGDIRPK
jgi:hypothetical protein